MDENKKMERVLKKIIEELVSKLSWDQYFSLLPDCTVGDTPALNNSSLADYLIASRMKSACEKKQCEHKRWRIKGGDLAGRATCLDCCETHFLDELINGTAERLQELEKRLEEKLNNG